MLVGYQNCKVYDVINIRPCFKCGRFGHNGKKCKNDPACLKCAGKHLTDKCTSTEMHCVNCIFSNKTFRNSYDTNHVATDRQECKILNTKVNKAMNTTDYTMKPTLPRYLGKVDNFKKRTHEVPNTLINSTPPPQDGVNFSLMRKIGVSPSRIFIDSGGTSSMVTRSRYTSQQDLANRLMSVSSQEETTNY